MSLPRRPDAPPPAISPDLIAAFEEMLRNGADEIEEPPDLERDLFELPSREEAQVHYQPEDLLELCDRLDQLLLSSKTMAEIFRTLSRTLREFFGSKYVEFLSLRGDGLIYEYITSPEWLLNLIRRMTGLTAVLGMRIPLFEGSTFKEFIEARRPRELLSFEERLRSMKDFLEPSTPERIRLRERWAGPLMQLFGYKYVFQVPLIVQGRFIGYFSFLQKRRFSRRVRADIVLLSSRISGLILLKQREEERRHNLSEGVATLEAIHDPKSSRVVGFRVRDVNPALLTIVETPREELINRPVEALGLLRRAELAGLIRVLESHVPTSFVVHVGDKVCRFLVSKAESEDLIVVVRDITERERAEEERRSLREQVLHAQKLESLGVLAGGIAHDFNNLLAAIQVNAELAALELPKDSPLQESLRDIQTASKRAADLTSQMLAYSGKGKFIVRPIDLSRLVLDMADLLRASISKKATLELRLADSLPPVAADPTQLTQIVVNLVTNASESLGEGVGRVTISTETRRCDRAYLSGTYVDDHLAEGRYVLLSVVDTGCGMSPDLLGKIFDPFFSTKFTGRGLGLPAVLGIVRGHEGAIRIESDVGHGTAFTVLFPERSLPVQLTPASTETAGAPWNGRGTILLVDDEEVVRSAGKRLLERIGFDVLLAQDGQEAVELFRRDAARIGCVIMDLTMPRMNGREATLEIHRTRADVPVLLSSGYTAQTALDGSVDHDVAGFIQKPYSLDVLRSKLRPLFDQRPETIFR
jgi:signal transduction histidine kinase